jgi:hypothetical protein
MCRSLFSLVLSASMLAGGSPIVSLEGMPQSEDPILTVIASHQYDLENGGRKFLLSEAEKSDFFLLGELHGDNEIPALLKVLWPEMWQQGYRYIAAEISPWAAHQLEFVPFGQSPEIKALWTKQEATSLHATAGPKATVLWGCDMEEGQPEYLIRELATLNPDDPNLKRMVALTRDGYRRQMAPELLELLVRAKGKRDEVVNDVSLRQNLLATLEIEKNRLSPDTRMIAQNERELLMKEQLLAHYRRGSTVSTASKVLLRFGRNHIHRGLDARGISTLGNFILEFAVSHGNTAFNVGAFGAGGHASLDGKSFDADERKDELAFALLAGKARHPATVFDLRPVRPLLHLIPREKRSVVQTNLTYWADSYDVLICYKTVTPLKPE